MHIDVFNDDAFSLSSLTAAINQMPHVPGRLGALGLFDESGITTTTATVEHQKGQLALVETSQRGAPAKKEQADPRSIRLFKTLHLKREAPILADEIQNLRAFGSESDVETMQSYVNQRLLKIKRKLDATLEWHRIGAVKGQILDADGATVLYDLFDEFGITQNTVSMVLGTGSTNIRGKINEAKRKAEDALGEASITGWVAVCGRNFIDAFTDHDKVTKAYEQFNQGEMLRKDVRGGFPFGDVNWEEYRGKVGSQAFIGDDDAYLIPLGVPDLFITRFAPADYIETANTMGLPYYAQQERMPMGRGINGEAQTNPISLCTCPGAIVKLTKA